MEAVRMYFVFHRTALHYIIQNSIQFETVNYSSWCLSTRRTSRCIFAWIVFFLYELLVIQTVTHYRQHKTEKTHWMRSKLQINTKPVVTHRPSCLIRFSVIWLKNNPDVQIVNLLEQSWTAEWSRNCLANWVPLPSVTVSPTVASFLTSRETWLKWFRTHIYFQFKEEGWLCKCKPVTHHTASH